MAPCAPLIVAVFDLSAGSVFVLLGRFLFFFFFFHLRPSSPLSEETKLSPGRRPRDVHRSPLSNRSAPVSLFDQRRPNTKEVQTKRIKNGMEEN